MKKLLPLSLAFWALTASLRAAIIQFDLIGTAGTGLLAGNETPTVVGGTGGEIGAGIFFDDVALQLTVNVGWGSGNGFTDLSSNVSNQHVHGPTTNSFGFDGTANFRQTAGVPAGFALTRTSISPVNGQIVNNVITFNATQAAQLMDGKFYINVHTANNGGGEARGFLIPVPEPGTAGLLSLGTLALLGRRRR